MGSPGILQGSILAPSYAAENIPISKNNWSGVGFNLKKVTSLVYWLSKSSIIGDLVSSSTLSCFDSSE